MVLVGVLGAFGMFIVYTGTDICTHRNKKPATTSLRGLAGAIKYSLHERRDVLNENSTRFCTSLGPNVLAVLVQNKRRNTANR